MLKSVLFILALCVVSCFAIPSEPPAGAFLIATKTLVHTEIVAHRDLVVSFEIFNIGQQPAYDVVLEDDSWPSDLFDKKVGLTSARWDRIAPGQNVSHVVIVTPKFSGEYYVQPATVQYRQSPKGPIQISHSTSPAYSLILERSDIERRQAPHLTQWAIFLAIVAVAVAPAFSVWWPYQNQKPANKKKN